MKSAEARRIARQRKILANPEDRMNRIIQDKKFDRIDHDESVSADHEVNRESILVTETEQTSELESEILGLQNSELLNPAFSGLPTSSLSTEDAKVKDFSTTETKKDAFFWKWSNFLFWFVFGVTVQLLLTKTELSWMIADNAFSAFVIVYLVKYFGLIARYPEGVASNREQGGLVFLALKMCGVNPIWIDVLKRSSQTIVDVSETFSIYFVAFLVTHFIVE